MGYTRSALSGFSNQTILKFISYGLVALKIAVLARTLGPNIIGTFSIVLIALGLTEAFTQTGVNLTMIRSKQSVEYFIDSAWVISIIRGIIIGIMMIIIGFFLSMFYENPELVVYIFVAALVPVIKGFINPSVIGLQKELKFFKDALYRFIMTFSDSIFAIIVGTLTGSIYALIGAMIFAALVEVAVSFLFFKSRPQFVYRKSRGEVILKGAKLLSVSALFDYLNENLDNLIVGKMLGVRSLGLYDYSYALAHKTNYDFAKSATHGTLPIFSKLRNSKQRLLRAFYRSTFATIFLVTLTSLPLLLFPEFFVRLILGREWLDVVPFLHWLVLAGILQSLSLMFYSLFVAKGRYLAINIHSGLTIVLMTSLVILLGGKYGLSGAAASILVARVIALPLLLYSFMKIRNVE